jgi:hypothetical protein
MSGIYGWWFAPSSLHVPDRQYIVKDGFQLLYTGISPRKPTNPQLAGSGNLRSRLRTHAKRDASWSTLRLSLGIMLAEQLGLALATHNGRTHWGPEGEARLSAWMGDHARVSWVRDLLPWETERELLAGTNIPLNIDQHLYDSFSDELHQRRRAAKEAARLLKPHRPLG